MLFRNRKKKKRESRIKIYLFFILILILGITWVEEKEYEKKISRIVSKFNEKLEKTNLKNIYLVYKEHGLSLLFINRVGEELEIEGLMGVGEIDYDTPIRVLKEGKFGFYSEKGELLIPFEYEQASDFIDGIAVVKKGKYGIIDETGKELLPYEYTNIILGEKRRVILERDNKYYLSDLKKGEEIEANYIYPIDEKKIIFEKEGLFGIMDFYGKILIPNEYEEISKNIDITFIGKKRGKYSIYSLENNRKLTKGYDYIEQLDKNVYIGGTNEIGKYAFLSSEFSTEEIYDEILRLDGSLYIGTCLYAGIKDEMVEILEENKGIIIMMSNEEFAKKMEEVTKNNMKE